MVAGLHPLRNDDAEPTLHGREHGGSLQKGNERDIPKNKQQLLESAEEFSENDAAS